MDLVHDLRTQGFALIKDTDPLDGNEIERQVKQSLQQRTPGYFIKHDVLDGFSLYALNYKDGPAPAYIRNEGVRALFKVWTDSGKNQHHAKNPYGSVAFMNFLHETGFSDSDYLICYQI